MVTPPAVRGDGPETVVTRPANGGKGCGDDARSADVRVSAVPSGLLGYKIYASDVAFHDAAHAMVIGYLPEEDNEFVYTGPGADKLFYGAVAVYEEGDSGMTVEPKSPSVRQRPVRQAPPPAGVFAMFTWSPATPSVGQAVQFTEQSIGGATNWSWSFGDGTGSTARNPAHIYGASGAYTVLLSTWNAGGISTASKIINVLSDPIP
jgi:hypothetical protein